MRVSMQPPPGIPAGWRFDDEEPDDGRAETVERRPLLVARHTGYGWVPFTFSPDVVVQMCMMRQLKAGKPH